MKGPGNEQEVKASADQDRAAAPLAAHASADRTSFHLPGACAEERLFASSASVDQPAAGGRGVDEILPMRRSAGLWPCLIGARQVRRRAGGTGSKGLTERSK
jgi:hypothetical protein